MTGKGDEKMIRTNKRMYLKVLRQFKQDVELFADWKMGQTKPMFIGFAFATGPKQPVKMGRSDLLQIKLFDEETLPVVLEKVTETQAGPIVT